jgi:hypothetical protein
MARTYLVYVLVLVEVCVLVLAEVYVLVVVLVCVLVYVFFLHKGKHMISELSSLLVHNS